MIVREEGLLLIIVAQVSDTLLYYVITCYFNPIRTTCRLVKMSIQACVALIRECVRKNSLMCKLLLLCYQTFIMIGLNNEINFHDINQSDMVLECQSVFRGLNWHESRHCVRRSAIGSCFLFFVHDLPHKYTEGLIKYDGSFYNPMMKKVKSKIF